jgi:hypothetical protein
MKGYPEGYPDPDNRHQVATAERHAARRRGKPPSAADLRRIAQSHGQRHRNGAQSSGGQARTWDEADLKRRSGRILTPAEQALLAQGF